MQRENEVKSSEGRRKVLQSRTSQSQSPLETSFFSLMTSFDSNAICPFESGSGMVLRGEEKAKMRGQTHKLDR